MDARPIVIRVLLLVALLPMIAASRPAAHAPKPISLTSGEEYEHLIGEVPAVRTDWSDITLDRWPSPWRFDLVVDASGNVVTAVPRSGPESHREAARQVALKLKFKPFEHDGKAVAAHFTMGVPAEATDYRGPDDRSATIRPDADGFRIALRRTVCFGTCPDYRIEVSADGRVSYHGIGMVLIEGFHEWRVPKSSVAELAALVDRANFFQLDGYYRLNVTDMPTFMTRVHAGPRDKFVFDYAAGTPFGDAVSTTAFGGAAPRMPRIVSELEQAVDSVAGDASWIEGDERTIEKLIANHWNFHSVAAGRALNFLVSNCKSDLALQFLERGAPATVAYNEGFMRESLAADAARCGNPELVERLARAGALTGVRARQQFLLASTASGNPETVALALQYCHDTKIMDSQGTPLLSIAAAALARWNDGDTHRPFDPARVVEMLAAAGADPNATDAEGNTPLFAAMDPGAVHALLKAGANPRVRNQEGQTPLFGQHFAEAKLVLLAVGTDARVRDRHARTALFNQDSPDVIRVLVSAGADVNAVSAFGTTALETAGSEAAALALLSLGAKAPSDGDRLAAWIESARERAWTRVLERIGVSPRNRTPD